MTDKLQIIYVLYKHTLLRTFVSSGMQLCAECMWLFPHILLPRVILYAQINGIGRNQTLETLALARYGGISLAKCIQQKEAGVQLSTINSKV